MNSWLGYDTTTPNDLAKRVAKPQFLFPYANGKFAWVMPGIWKGTPMAHIDVLGNDWQNAGILDVESGDATPTMAPGWIRNRIKIGPATIYCNRATLPSVQSHCKGLDFWVWLATLDGTVCYSAVPGGIGKLAAVQGWGANALGFHADLSVILSSQWFTFHGGKV